MITVGAGPRATRARQAHVNVHSDVHKPYALDFPTDPGVSTVRIQGYRQTDDFSCGAVAGFTVLSHYLPRRSFAAYYKRSGADPKNGTSTTDLKNGLRASGLHVRHERALDFDAIVDSIERRKQPILLCVSLDAETDHWVVLYGVRKNPRAVFISGDKLPVYDQCEIPWAQFQKRWSPRGDGIIAWAT